MKPEQNLNTCDCCDPPALSPVIHNRSGLGEIAYRIADYGIFLQRMIQQIGRRHLFGLDQSLLEAARQYGLDQSQLDQLSIAIVDLLNGLAAGQGEVQAIGNDFKATVTALDAGLLQSSGFSSEMDRLLALLGRNQLTSRAEDDFSIGLLDSWAVVGDVLTFYQERLANEGYLRTAVERRSILEMARAIGYELNPGVAAETYLAFTVDDGDSTPDEIEIPAGTQVQSLPQKQDELPQTFETANYFVGRPAWNLLRPRLTESQLVEQGTTRLFFSQINHNLRVGDRLLFIGAEKEADAASEVWDVRRIVSVATIPAKDQTEVVVEASATGRPFPADPDVYLFQEEASIFGHNASDWPALSNQIKADYLGLDDPSHLTAEDKIEWPNYTIFAPTGTLGVGSLLEEPVLVTARMVADTAIGAAETQSKMMTRAAAAAAPDAVFKAVGVLENVVRDFAGAAIGGLTLPTGADVQSPLYTIVDNVRQIIAETTLSPPIAADLIDLSASADYDANVFDNLVSLINEALSTIRALPVTISLAPDIAAHFNNIGDALKTLWELNPSLRILQGLAETVDNTSAELSRASRAANRAAGEAIGAGAATAMSAALEAVVEGVMPFDPQPEEVHDIVRFVTRVMRYAAELPTMAELEADPDFQLDLSEPDHDSLLPFSVQLTDRLPQELRNLEDEENRRAFYTAVGALGAGAAGAMLALGPLAATIPPYILMPGVAAGIMPLLMAAPGVSKGSDQFYHAVNIAVDELMATHGTTRAVAQQRAFYQPSTDKVDLDSKYERITPGSWVCFSVSNPGDTRLFFVEDVDETSRSEFMISAKVTRLKLDGPGLADFSGAVRELTVYGAPKPLPLTEVEILDPVDESAIDLDSLPPAFAAGQKLLITGVPENESEGTGETATVKSFEISDSRGRLLLENELAHAYQRSTVAIYGNVIRATHGETVGGEVLGHGSGAVSHQSFKLRKPPLTYVPADTVTGSESTLSVTVDDVEWEQTASFYDQQAMARIYTVRLDDEGKAVVTFGDGRMGARLPTGVENVVATYRSGIGLAGEVGAGTLTLLKTKPLGVRAVNNPLAADGSEDPESRDDARQNAPMTVRTLDRVVSLRDYEDFAATFAGIGKAQAVAVWNGSRELVHLTVADPTGHEVGSDKIALLLSALNQVRDLRRDVIVETFTPLTFSLVAGVAIDDGYSWERVSSELVEILMAAFSFEQRAFGQPVSAAEVVASFHQVEGVRSVDLDALYIDGAGQDGTLSPVLAAGIARYNRNSTAADIADRIDPAGILTVNPAGITLEEKAA